MFSIVDALCVLSAIFTSELTTEDIKPLWLGEVQGMTFLMAVEGLILNSRTTLIHLAYRAGCSQRSKSELEQAQNQTGLNPSL